MVLRLAEEVTSSLLDTLTFEGFLRYPGRNIQKTKGTFEFKSLKIEPCESAEQG